MHMDRAPHYLRVVQALALVSGFGPVALVIADCSNDDAYVGVAMGAADSGGIAYYGDSAGVILDGSAPPGEGALDAVALPSDAAEAGPDANDAETDVTTADASTDAEADATPDVTTDGGPLPPPDLPA